MSTLDVARITGSSFVMIETHYAHLVMREAREASGSGQATLPEAMSDFTSRTHAERLFAGRELSLGLRAREFVNGTAGRAAPERPRPRESCARHKGLDS